MGALTYIKLGVVAAFVSVVLGWHLSAVSKAKDAGRAEIRIEWAEANRKAELQALDRQKQQQTKIDAADAELARQRTETAVKTSDLETALAAEREKRNEKGAPVCLSPPMPDSVRNALNSIR